MNPAVAMDHKIRKLEAEVAKLKIERDYWHEAALYWLDYKKAKP